MEPQNPAQQILEGRETPRSRRTSFSPLKALRSLSISSQVSQASQVSSISDSDLSSPVTGRRRTLRKGRQSEALKEELIRKASTKSSVDDAADHTSTSTSTRPTSPSGTGSQGTSISGDFATVLKSGPLQQETSLLKTKKEQHLVLTAVALMKFKSSAAANEQFPLLSAPSSGVEALSPVQSSSSFRDLGNGAETYVPLEKVVSVFRDEGTRPSFGIEVWWRNLGAGSTFSCLQLDFRLPDDRDEWMKQIRYAVKSRAKSFMDERAPADIEQDFRLILEAKHKHSKDTQVDVYPIIPRRPYSRLIAESGEVKKTWRDASSFYLAFSKYSLLLAQFSRSPTGQKVNPSLVRFGLVALARVNTNMNDERFDLIFRLPLDQPKKLELSSRYHRVILSKLLKADTYLKPAWPLWTRREVFLIDGESQQTPLPNGEDYGGFKTTLEAFLEGYHCPPVDWTVKWKDVRNPPEFHLLPPKKQSQYTSHQILAVFRALRFNDFFKSISFCDIDFCCLSGVFDNTERLESTVWLSRTGKRSLTRPEFDLMDNSCVLFQEIVSLLLGSESVKHVGLGNVLGKVHTASVPGSSGRVPSPGSRVCEIMPPIILLLKSLQTRCNSLNLSGNPLGEADVVELSRVLQTRPNFLIALDVSRCFLDENTLNWLWEGLHEQRSSIEVLDTSQNSGRVEATRVAYTLNEASKLKRLNLANSIKGNLEGSLFRPWSTTTSFAPWRLEELDLSGWKVNFDTLCGIMNYVELDESRDLRRLAFNNCGLTGEMATGILCRLGAGRDLHLFLNENPLERGSTDWIDLIHGNEAPKMLHLDMIQFQHESSFNRLLTALTHNETIEFLSMVGTGPPARAGSKTSELLSRFFESNCTLKFLDLSGYSGKLEDGHLGWGLSEALGGLKKNVSLCQLRVRNHDIGAAEDVSELCRVLTTNKGLAMFDIQNNNFDHHQFSKLVHALSFNHRIISFPLSDADREYVLQKERKWFMEIQGRPGKDSQAKVNKSTESRLDGLLTWLENHWNAEAKKAQDTLARNRGDRANQALEFESDYLDAWDDQDLPSWLVPKPRVRQKGKEKATQQRPDPSSERTSTISCSPDTTVSALGTSYGTSGSGMPTYTIEEESSGSDYGPSPLVGTHFNFSSRMEQDRREISPGHSPTDYQDVIKDIGLR